MQLDDKTANAVSVRPTAAAAGALRWFRARDLGGGITGTTMEEDYLNDHLGSVIAILAAGNVTRTKGAAGDSDMLNAFLDLIGQRSPATLEGQLKRTSASVIQLQPVVGTEVVVSVDNKQIKKTGVLNFDMATDLEQAEAASKPLYLYVRENPANTLDEQISETVPDRPGGTKPGYKSGDATRRCIGSTWNDVGQDLIECSWGPGGVLRLHSHDGDHEHSLSLTQAGWSSVQAVNVPLCASAFEILWHSKGGVRQAALAASDASTNPTVTEKILGTNASEILHYANMTGPNTPRRARAGLIPVADMAAPGFKFTTYGGTLDLNDLVITGWHDIFAPR